MVEILGAVSGFFASFGQNTLFSWQDSRLR